MIDIPGHRNYINSTMYQATTQLDYAILVVSAGTGEFEAGIAYYGQAREHSLLAFVVGIKYLIVCVSKMDVLAETVAETRFNEIQVEVGKWTKKVGVVVASAFSHFRSVTCLIKLGSFPCRVLVITFATNQLVCLGIVALR